MNRIKEWLKNNPRKNGSVESELFKFGINFYHVFSLLWKETTRKYTNNFIIYKVQEMLEIFISNLPDDVQMEYVDERIKEARDVIIKEGMSFDDMINYMGAEIDNYSGNKYGLSIDFKIAFLLEALKTIGISEDQIFEKYQN